MKLLDTASTLEQFRVRQDLEGSKCPMEIIKCEPYQGTHKFKIYTYPLYLFIIPNK